MDAKHALPRQELCQMLAKQYACFVLITCDEPTEQGRIEVEMSYEGDPALAAYLIESAGTFIEEEA